MTDEQSVQLKFAIWKEVVNHGAYSSDLVATADIAVSVFQKFLPQPPTESAA